MVDSAACLNCAGGEVDCEAVGCEAVGFDVEEFEIASDLDCGVDLGCGVGGSGCGVLEVGCEALTNFVALGVNALEVIDAWSSCVAHEMDCGAYYCSADLGQPGHVLHRPTFHQ